MCFVCLQHAVPSICNLKKISLLMQVQNAVLTPVYLRAPGFCCLVQLELERARWETGEHFQSRNVKVPFFAPTSLARGKKIALVQDLYCCKIENKLL